MANVLTGIRIICGILILVFPAFSGWYYLLYLLGGFTDAIDGTVARKTGKVTEFGERFDTVADAVFAIAVIIKIIRALVFPKWLTLWIVVIFLIKAWNVTYGFVKYKSFVTVHSAMNRACGTIVFIIPLFIGANIAWQLRMLATIFACAFATITAMKENGDIIKWQNNFDTDGGS